MRINKSVTTTSIFSTSLNRKVSFYFFSTLKEDEEGPLLIMHDGQNLFDDQKAAYGASWRFIEAMNDPKCPKIRVLGISNCESFEGRIDEYSPFIRRRFKNEGLSRPCGGKGDIYLDFVMNEVLPQYKKKYPTTKVYMGGSSLGGFITLIAALDYTEQLDGAFGLSNAWWFAEKKLIRKIEKFKGTLPRFYLDTGTKESDDPKINLGYLKSQESVLSALIQKENNTIRAEVIQSAKHFETDWAKRLLEVLIWVIQ
jgi:predicted alpha/beta superfamily hydrolase